MEYVIKERAIRDLILDLTTQQLVYDASSRMIISAARFIGHVLPLEVETIGTSMPMTNFVFGPFTATMYHLHFWTVVYNPTQSTLTHWVLLCCFVCCFWLGFVCSMSYIMSAVGSFFQNMFIVKPVKDGVEDGIKKSRNRNTGRQRETMPDDSERVEVEVEFQ